MNDQPIAYQGVVYPWHCDHMGHMNVMWYVGKFDEATWHHLASVGITAEYMNNNARGMAAVEQNIKYKAELHAGDLVIIRSHWVEIKAKSVRFCLHMYNAQTNTLAATCDQVAVHIDTKTRKAHTFDAFIANNVESAIRQE